MHELIGSMIGSEYKPHSLPKLYDTNLRISGLLQIPMFYTPLAFNNEH